MHREKESPVWVEGSNRLLDELLQRYSLKNDAALAKVLRVSPARLSKLRHGRLRITPDIFVRIHDAFAMPFDELRTLMGVDKDSPPSRKGHFDSVTIDVGRYRPSN